MEYAKPQIVYVVQRLGWKWNDEFYTVHSETPTKAFVRRRDAETYCGRCDAEERENWTEEQRTYQFRSDTDRFFEVVEVPLET